LKIRSIHMLFQPKVNTDDFITGLNQIQIQKHEGFHITIPSRQVISMKAIITRAILI